MEFKTNVMRILDKEKIPYKSHCVVTSGAISGTEIADALGVPYERVFKTLVTVAKSKRNYVFVIPVEKELDLKKAAACVGEKAIEMLKAKDLLGLTGYVHGGCSPIGMKKVFTTVFDNSSQDFDEIFFSAGKIGYQVEINVNEAAKIINPSLGDITVSD